MKTARLFVIVCCLLVAFTIVTYAAERFQMEQTALQRDHALRSYGKFVLQCAWGLVLLVAAIVWSWMENRQADMCIARFGQKTFLVHRKNLQHFYPIAIALALLEMRKSVSTICGESRRPDESDEGKVFHGNFIQNSADEFSSSTPNFVA
jgi:cytochrome bd-type quinol oxidase subunit 2